jgi:hypothetical protein
MSQKPPLNFAQALRLKPVERQEEPKLELVEDRTPIRPILEVQPPTLAVQPPGSLDAQASTEDETKYPSRVLRRKKTIRLPIQKLEKYESYCFFHKIDFQDAVERALDALTSGRLGAHVLIDEKDEVKSDEVLIYYRKVTGNRVTKKDEEARAEAKGFSAEACKIGILTSILRAPVKINSFRYCLGAIEEVANSPIQDLSQYMAFLEQQLKGRKDANDQPK